jgi:2-polyprenyl-6-methoxyphenol hydroxylase-like FAD-dependent oxidoreductase
MLQDSCFQVAVKVNPLPSICPLSDKAITRLTVSIGSSFGIEDATVLANSLLNNPPSKDSGFRTALEEYARLRLPRSKKMAKVADYAGRFGLGEQWYWRWLRDYGTKWMMITKDPKA